jgi:hypothetical protein
MSIHWSIRYSAFALSVWTLSLFFAGWRMVNTEGSIAGFLTLAGGTILTLGLLVLQGYWIYFEELNKGSLRRRIRLFEWLHELVNRDEKLANNRLIRLIQPVVSEGKDDNR